MGDCEWYRDVGHSLGSEGLANATAVYHLQRDRAQRLGVSHNVHVHVSY